LHGYYYIRGKDIIMKNKTHIFLVSALCIVSGCASYESRPVPVRPASSYSLQAQPQPQNTAAPQYTATPAQPQATAASVQQLQTSPVSQPAPLAGQTIPGQGQTAPLQGQVVTNQAVPYAGAGLNIGADVLSDPERCKQYFGVDLNKAEVLPVQLVYTNSGNHILNIQRGQVFAVDNSGNMWQALTTEQATDRIAGSEVGRDLAVGAGKGALIGGAGGVALGAALGAVMGDAGKGAMVGAAAGGIGGGGVGAAREKEKIGKIVQQDVMSKALQDQQVYPGYIVSGFVFLPKGNYNRIEITVFDATVQQSMKYTITPQGSF
jgi:hypothetical protein